MDCAPVCTTAATVTFDTAVSFDPGSAGCGYLAFFVRDVNGNPVQGYPSYTATATTQPAVSEPRIYNGYVSSNGVETLYYCPPSYSAVEVTFTATVQAVTGARQHFWGVNPTQPCDVACTATTLSFENAYLSGPEPGCGYIAFRAYNANSNGVQGNPAYTATATTAGVGVPQTYNGNVDSSGRATLYYCPPAAVVVDPVEVTFTATVGAATGVALRSWDPDAGTGGTGCGADTACIMEQQAELNQFLTPSSPSCPAGGCLPPADCSTVCGDPDAITEPIVDTSLPSPNNLDPFGCWTFVADPKKHQTPVDQWGNQWVYLNFRGFIDCDPHLDGIMRLTAERHRWYGWQEMARWEATINDRTGDKAMNRDMHCNRNVAGTFNWRGVVTVIRNSPGGTDDAQELGNHVRYTCKNTNTGS